MPKVTSPRAWLDRLDRSRHALWLLFAASMLETLLIPIPIEVILIPWMLCHPERKWTIAGVALAGNLAAATLGYYFGVFAMDQWGDTLINFFGSQEAYEDFQTRFNENGFVSVVTIGIVPIPFQIAMLVAGANGYPVLLFLLAAIIGRGVRYFGLALLVTIAGDAAMKLWEKYSKPLGVLLLVLAGVWLWYEIAG